VEEIRRILHSRFIGLDRNTPHFQRGNSGKKMEILISVEVEIRRISGLYS